MAKKLVSLNFSMKLIVKNGKQERDVRFTGVLPSKAFAHASQILVAMCDVLNDEFGTDFFVDWSNAHVLVLKPKRISRPVVDTERIIKELVT